MRYTTWADQRFNFNTYYDKQTILDTVAETQYYGQGTFTALALMNAATQALQVILGERKLLCLSYQSYNIFRATMDGEKVMYRQWSMLLRMEWHRTALKFQQQPELFNVRYIYSSLNFITKIHQNKNVIIFYLG